MTRTPSRSSLNLIQLTASVFAQYVFSPTQAGSNRGRRGSGARRKTIKGKLHGIIDVDSPDQFAILPVQMWELDGFPRIERQERKTQQAFF